jgi:hypothetical protein
MLSKGHTGLSPLLEEFQVPSDPFSRLNEVEKKVMYDVASLICGVMVSRYGCSADAQATYWPKDPFQIVFKIDVKADPARPDKARNDKAAISQFVSDLTRAKSEEDPIYFVRNDNISDNPTMSAYVPALLPHIADMISQTPDSDGLSARLALLDAIFEKQLNANLPRYRI